MTKITGACRCGATQIEVQGKPLATKACHCTGCQKMTASAFSLSAMYPATAFTVVAGTPILGGLKAETRHYFCPGCYSWMFTRPAGNQDIVNVRATMLENAAEFAPFFETYVSEKLAWAKTGARHSFAQFPAMQDYLALMAEFAQS